MPTTGANVINKFLQGINTLCRYKAIDSVSIPRLLAPSCHLLGKINAIGSFFLSLQTEVQQRCHIEKNVPIVFILPSRWQDGAESLGIETTSCL